VLSAALGSRTGKPGLSWRANGSYTQTEFDLGSEFKYANVALDVGYPVGLRTRATATVGQESDIQEDPAGGDLDVTYWYVGFAWNPNELQSLEARVGERYFGTAFDLNYRRRASRGEIGVSYTEEPTTSSGVLGGEETFIPGTRPGGSPTLDTRVFLRKRLSANATYELVRSRIGASLYAEARDFEDALGGTERVYGARANYDWDFAQRTTLGASIDWERRKLPNSDREDDYGDFGVRVMRELTRTLSGMLRVSHFLRNADGANDYNANQVALSVEAKF
jgi:opacity protein-like surface antigen